MSKRAFSPRPGESFTSAQARKAAWLVTKMKPDAKREQAGKVVGLLLMHLQAANDASRAKPVDAVGFDVGELNKSA